MIIITEIHICDSNELGYAHNTKQDIESLLLEA